MHVTGWSRKLKVTADGESIVSHAGLALGWAPRQLADKTGLPPARSTSLRLDKNSAPATPAAFTQDNRTHHR